jgi:hypothetical protein
MLKSRGCLVVGLIAAVAVLGAPSSSYATAGTDSFSSRAS